MSIIPAFILFIHFIGIASAQDPLKSIYPWKAIETEDFESRVTYMTEDNDPLINVFEMDRRGLTSVNSTIQPWGGSFWPLIQGQIANTWQDKTYAEPWELAN